MSVFFKKQTVASYSLLASFVLGLIGFIIYLVNSTTGFLAGQPVDALLIALTIVALLLIVLEFTLHDKLEMFNGVSMMLYWLLSVFSSLCLAVYSSITESH